MPSFSTLIHLFRQDWRLASFKLLMIALALAVSSLTAVLLTADRFAATLSGQAASLLAGDLLVVADAPPSQDFAKLAKAAGLQHSATVSFQSVALRGQAQALVIAKTVDNPYPLRGTLKVLQLDNNRAAVAVKTLPQAGEAWVDETILHSLNAKLGDEIELGNIKLRLAAVIAQEPDRGAAFASFAPRLMFNAADLSASGLISDTSRATYRHQFAGSPAAIAAFNKALSTQLTKGQRIETLTDGRPEMRTVFDRSTRLLSLVALLTAVLASCGAWLAAKQYSLDKTAQIALSQALGAAPKLVAKRVAFSLLLAASSALLLGFAIAWGVQAALSGVLETATQLSLPQPSPAPLLGVTGLFICLVWVCLGPTVLALLQTPPVWVLRQSAVNTRLSNGWRAVNAAAMLCLLGFFTLVAGSYLLAAAVLGGLLLAALTLAVLWKLLLAALSKTAAHSGAWVVRNAGRGLRRQPKVLLLQGVALATALLCLLLLWIIQADVIQIWRKASPANAPNHFVFNIQPEQVPPVNAALTQLGIAQNINYPMIRARLIARNDTPVGPEQYEADNAKRLVSREFNVSYTAQLPNGNSVTQGAWHNNSSANEISMEAGIMKTLKLKLGDKLTFEVGGQAVNLTITSVRQLKWESMQPNFFAITPPAVAKDLPQSFITSVYVPPGTNMASLVRAMPNLTVLDAQLLIAQAQTLIGHVTRALTVLFALALLAGALVVLMSSLIGRQARQQEAAIAQAFGATPRAVLASFAVELSALGFLSGAAAGLAAWLLGSLIMQYGLELQVWLSPWPIATGALLGILTQWLAAGWIGLQLRRTQPAQTLRAGV